MARWVYGFFFFFLEEYMKTLLKWDPSYSPSYTPTTRAKASKSTFPILRELTFAILKSIVTDRDDNDERSYGFYSNKHI